MAIAKRLVGLVCLAALLMGCGQKGLRGGKEVENPNDRPDQLPSQAGPASDPAHRAIGRNNLRQIGIAMHNYADYHADRLPPSAICTKDGKPLLSWRVALLPWLDQDELYKQFKLDEPWDGPHNKKLLARMPKMFANPRANTTEPYVTFYRIFIGPNTLWPGPGGESKFLLGERPSPLNPGANETADTIFAVEAPEGVPWTKPDELVYDPQKPLALLDKNAPDVFVVVMLDGSVRAISKTISEKELRTLIVPRGRQSFSAGKSFPPPELIPPPGYRPPLKPVPAPELIPPPNVIPPP